MKVDDNQIVTILTPTYNRYNTLPMLYESLINQTKLNFKWIIVDDGSSDSTKSLIDKYMKENLIQIEYIYQSNGGKHRALNTGIKKINTPLTFIVDSDDYLVETAIEIINNDYDKITDDKYVGLIYLKGYSNEEVIGTTFSTIGYSNWNKMRWIDKIKGDKAEVWKTRLLQETPFPTFDGETFLGEHYVWTLLSEKHDAFFSNKIIYICKYLDNGLTKSGRTLRIKNPLGGIVSSKILTKKNYPIDIRIKNTLLYICYSKFSKICTSKILLNAESRLLTTIMMPLGEFLYMYWNLKYMRAGD